MSKIPDLSLSPILPFGNHKFVFYVCKSGFCFVNKFIVYFFRFYMWYNICFCLTSFIMIYLDPSMLLRMALFILSFIAEQYSIVCVCVCVCVCVYIYNSIIYVYMYTHHIFFIHSPKWWTFRLLPWLGYCKCCCYEHWGVYIFLR